MKKKFQNFFINRNSQLDSTCQLENYIKFVHGLIVLMDRDFVHVVRAFLQYFLQLYTTLSGVWIRKPVIL